MLVVGGGMLVLLDVGLCWVLGWMLDVVSRSVNIVLNTH